MGVGCESGEAGSSNFSGPKCSLHFNCFSSSMKEKKIKKKTENCLTVTKNDTYMQVASNKPKNLG